MLNRLQSLFNRLAGVPDHVAYDLARPYKSFAALQKPACWRRRPRNQAAAQQLGEGFH